VQRSPRGPGGRAGRGARPQRATRCLTAGSPGREPAATGRPPTGPRPPC